ncbi:MAG TPA: hypothetical protein VL882_25855 [Vicinamibacterales bacterium]|jgi:hypothetical protein|nr:hypothetical protein [Vicinamibacterales bacterium]
MVGAFIVIGMLALGPGPDADDVNVTRGVMSAAVAYHVRSTDPRVQEWLRIGAAESRTFRSLLNLLGESDLIVHVQLVDRLATAGQTYFVNATATIRYVRIEVEFRSSLTEMVALIGHELQHAVEIAQQPRIRDRQTLALFYKGMPGNSMSTTVYDSVAARVMEDRVRREMWGAVRSDSRPSTSTLVAEKGRYKREPGR